jgi:hypothetical protein
MRLAAILLCAWTAFGADISGMWMGQIPARDQMLDIAFQFTQTGDTVSGKLYGDYESTAITEGRISGENVSFVVTAKEQAGNQINETRLRFTGTLKDGILELTRERESSKNAGNSGAAGPVRENSKLTFRVKRLL